MVKLIMSGEIIDVRSDSDTNPY